MLANRLFGQSGYPFKPAFLETVDRDDSAPLEAIDFIGDPEGSRERINHWVEQKTDDRIKDLLPGGSITSDTRLVLTNATYFKATWKRQFEKDATYDDSFFDAAGNASTVPMMHQQNYFRYAERPDFQLLEMPYVGDDLAMVMLLPKDRDGLPALEASLTSQALDESFAALSSERVSVTLPKFEFRDSFSLRAGAPEYGDDRRVSGRRG